ncbi:MAG: hypothetical protein COW30_01795 [Rhodospirillales bacterium CG15_BIG_FIL_POST_REV_8_21_14_020_66_15]|nr:MAG: hypothetical protein COW30_01795 [Rhodospirillales bacterium CG15_BIG_FIL_POST_REV_8_21_14_020_66_15]
MSDLTIYGTTISPFTRTVRMCLEEKEEAYRIYEYMPGSEEQKQEHPFGKVPAIRDADVHLYETLAICIYIDEEYTSDPQLQPRDAVEKADMFQRISLYLDEGYPNLGPGLIIPRLVNPMVGKPVDDAKIKDYLPKIERYLAVADKELRGRRWMVGDEMSLADMFLAPAIYYVKMTPEGQKLLSRLENLSAWYTNMTTVESFRETAPKLGGK